MNRKVVLSISAFLIVVDLVVGVALFTSGERQIAASLAAAAAVIELVRDYIRPIPRLAGLP